MNQEDMYPLVEKAVLWDEPKSKVVSLMVANDMADFEIEELYQRARSVRIDHIRFLSKPKLLKGVLLLFLAAALFFLFLFGFGGINVWLMIGCGYPCLHGLWSLTLGAYQWLLAPQQKGSVADLE